MMINPDQSVLPSCSEIVETELKYGKDLRIIVDEFYHPMLGTWPSKHVAKNILVHLAKHLAKQTRGQEYPRARGQTRGQEYPRALGQTFGLHCPKGNRLSAIIHEM